MILYNSCTDCRHVGMADETDSKSVVRKGVRVQVPLPALYMIEHSFCECISIFTGCKHGDFFIGTGKVVYVGEAKLRGNFRNRLIII